jgi:tellurite resistance protein TehA-like permease
MATQTTDASPTQAKPAWLAPVVIIVVIAVLAAGSTKKKEVLENPLMDLVVITIGVFAFAAVFRVIGGQLAAPGMVAFFGGSPDAAPSKMGRSY